MTMHKFGLLRVDQLNEAIRKAFQAPSDPKQFLIEPGTGDPRPCYAAADDRWAPSAYPIWKVDPRFGAGGYVEKWLPVQTLLHIVSAADADRIAMSIIASRHNEFRDQQPRSMTHTMRRVDALSLAEGLVRAAGIGR